LVIYSRAGHGISEYFHRLDQIYREHRWVAKYTFGEEALTDLGDWGREGIRLAGASSATVSFGTGFADGIVQVVLRR